MGLADRDAQAGWNELEVAEGQCLDYRNSSVIAVVNFPTPKEVVDRGDVIYDDGQNSDVMVDNHRIARPPRPGEEFYDPKGRFHHRIKAVAYRGGKWYCACAATRSEREDL
jgi:hypothetical protein